MNYETFDMPVLALRGLNIFPEMMITLDVQRDISIKAVETAMEENQLVFITSQKDSSIEKPKFDDVYEYGVIALIKQILRLPNNCMRVLVEGKKIAKLVAFSKRRPYILGKIENVELKTLKRKTKKTEAMARQIGELFEEYFSLSNHIQPDAVILVNSAIDDLERFSYLVASNIHAPVEKRQEVLEITSTVKRLEALIKLLISENEILRIEEEIESKVRAKKKLPNILHL